MPIGTIEWQVLTMVTERSTHSDIVRLFGPIEDHLAREILENPASRSLFDHCTRVDLDAVHCPDNL